MLPGRTDSFLKGVRFNSHGATAFLFYTPWPGGDNSNGGAALHTLGMLACISQGCSLLAVLQPH